MPKKKTTPHSSYEIYQTIRRNWGGLNPTTRIKGSDKIYSRQKNKKESRDFFDEEYHESDYFSNEEN